MPSIKMEHGIKRSKERRLELDGRKQRPVALPIYELYISGPQGHTYILCSKYQKTHGSPKYEKHGIEPFVIMNLDHCTIMVS